MCHRQMHMMNNRILQLCRQTGKTVLTGEIMSARTMYLRNKKEIAIANRILKKHGYKSTIKELQQNNRFLINILARLNVDFNVMKEIWYNISYYREVR